MSTPELVTPALLRKWSLPEPGGSKHDRGHLLVIGGARTTPGAAQLAGLAALRVGAGVLAMAVPDPVAIPLAVATPEALVTGWSEPPADPSSAEWDQIDQLIDGADAVVLGPGLDSGDVAQVLVRHLAEVMKPDTPLVLDAYALGALAEIGTCPAQLAGRTVLTPNHSEASRLLDGEPGGDGDDPVRLAPLIARRWQSVVAYYGAVATADGSLWSVPTGHAGLGTSGSGDVLAGAVTGLLARGADAAQAACWGTYLHAAAGDRLAARVGRLGFLAGELLPELPLVLTELRA